MQNEVNSPKMHQDVAVSTGNYWHRLWAAGQDIRIREFACLAEIFLNNEIEAIINACYECALKPAAWSPEQRPFALGS